MDMLRRRVSTLCLILLVIAWAESWIVNARPVVRNIRTHEEFKRLIKYHKEVTGLGIVVDFYSDGW